MVSSYDDDSERRGKSKRCRQWTLRLFIICQRSIYTGLTIFWSENGHTSFSRNVKSSGDIRCVVLCDVRIDRSAIKRISLVRGELRQLSRKLNVAFIKFLKGNRAVVKALLCYKYNRAPQALVFRVIIYRRDIITDLSLMRRQNLREFTTEIDRRLLSYERSCRIN